MITLRINNGRANDNPLIINTIEVTGENNSTNNVNVVISVKKDANKILIANKNSNTLKYTSVVFVK